MTRDDMVAELAWAIYEAIRSTQPSAFLYSNRPERSRDTSGKITYEGLDEVGLDGSFNLLTLADELFGRIS